MQAPAVKTCKMCRMDIPFEARKCPHCHHFQSRLLMATFHPAFIALFVAIPLLTTLFVYIKLFDSGEFYENYSDQVVITEYEIAFGSGSKETVAVIGTIRNDSPVPWKEIRFHADFFNHAGQRIDVAYEAPYTYFLPANETSSFKISFPAEFPRTNYASAVVRVVSAKDARSRW